MPMNGEELLKLFEKHGWRKVRQRGSHVIVHKEGQAPETIPMHKELKKGLEHKLLKRLQEKK
jgi:predicted RNA binding protein YcfA (HicA-like mRNA interferase family)